MDYDALYPLNTSDNQRFEWASMYTMLHQVYSAIMASGGVKVDALDINELLPKHLQQEKPIAVTGSQVLQSQIRGAFRV